MPTNTFFLRSGFFRYVLCLLGALLIMTVVEMVMFIYFYKDDVFAKHLQPSDQVFTVFSWTFSRLDRILLYALFFSVSCTAARMKVRQIRLSVAGLFVLAALLCFYLNGWVNPKTRLQALTMYWGILEAQDGEKVKYEPSLFKGAPEVSTYPGISSVLDSLVREKDSAKNRRIRSIKYMASPLHIEKLLAEPAFASVFTKEDFEGITDKGSASWTNPQAENNVRALMANTMSELGMREEQIIRYRNEKSKMVFFPFHVLCFCFIGFFTGMMLHRVNKWLLLFMNLALLAPFAVLVVEMFSKCTGTDGCAVTTFQWRLLVMETALAMVLWLVWYKYPRHLSR